MEAAKTLCGTASRAVHGQSLEKGHVHILNWSQSYRQTLVNLTYSKVYLFLSDLPQLYMGVYGC